MQVSGDVFLNSDAFLFVIFLILLLQLRERKVSMVRLLIMPIIMTIASLPFFYAEASVGWFPILLIIIGLVVGLILGVFLGSLMEVKLREEDGKIVMKGSILVVIIWGIIITLKVLGKNYLNANHVLSLDLLTSIFLAITLGTMISRRIIIYRQYYHKKKLHSQNNRVK
ncbi:CcdC protein domain-containing protein [uncultured Methanobacterium sp.]|uniref:CcdC protein domain-containing protein n=1 Tax=uncultured Methanobacterium sp. TaxID=176306 RepID=UPI002AA646F5|nr:CcdC protein domain-containing protein [uncultured Methanobacterium sp.]